MNNNGFSPTMEKEEFLSSNDYYNGNRISKSTLNKNEYYVIVSPDKIWCAGDWRYSYESLVKIANYLLDQITSKPKIGIICGSGMGYIAELVSNPQIFSYESIPNFPVSTVAGHKGQFVFGHISNVPVVCMQGRFHYYEGYPLWMCTMPVRVMKLLGVCHLIASNAAGGLNKNYKVGDIMLIKDHVNIMGFAGNNPLQGVNDERFGPRFLSMHMAYHQEIVKKAREIAENESFSDWIQEGVYTCLGGPSFETVAELRLLNLLGVDAVGMSTVHEVVTARHCGMTAFAFSLITNKCVTNYNEYDGIEHEDVINVGLKQKSILMCLISKIVEYINEEVVNIV